LVVIWKPQWRKSPKIRLPVRQHGYSIVELFNQLSNNRQSSYILSFVLLQRVSWSFSALK